MQLGTRWNLGDEPPERIPAQMVEAVRAVEAEVGPRQGWRWTLTWLESRPVAELDDGTVVRLGHDGSVAVTAPD
ncbi:MAG TPA: hypothetical protein VN200_09895 [Rhodoglobus sp.]|nr:hypothetical protein [Rhodoglobus sp.]